MNVVKYLIVGLIAVTACFEAIGKQKTDIVVVGAGIVGASIAYHLTQDGYSVTVLDREAPASHASRGTFAWLNASWAKQPDFYHNLNQESIKDWRSLAKKLDIPINWNGSLEWFSSKQRSAKLVAQVDEQVSWGESTSIVSAQYASNLEPSVLFPHNATIAYAKNDGAVDPVLATNKLLQKVTLNGGSVRYPCDVTEIKKGDSFSTVITNCGDFEAPKVVLAVGANSKFIYETTGIDIPQRTTPGIIAITKPLPKIITRVLSAPGVHIHQRLDGRIVLGEQAGAPQTPHHKQRLISKPNHYPNRELAQEHFNRMLKLAVKIIPELNVAELDDIYIGWRPLPIDGHPVLGFSDNSKQIYLAITHSGVTLAPIIGKMVTKELSNEYQDKLEPYRPHREFKTIKRY